MTDVEQYQNGIISLDELIYKLYTIDNDKDWVKDCLHHVLNTANHAHAMKVLKSL